jgi:hypothetical protein
LTTTDSVSSFSARKKKSLRAWVDVLSNALSFLRSLAVMQRLVVASASDILLLKVNILANSTWSGILSYFQGIKIKRFTKW